MKKFMLSVIVCFTLVALTGCSDVADTLITTKYVKAVLDKTYLGELDEYLEIVDINKVEALKEYNEGIDMEAEFLLEMYGAEDASSAYKIELSKLYREIYAKSKYEVKEGVKDGDKVKVEVVIHPIDIYKNTYEKLDEAYYEIANEESELSSRPANAMAKKIIEILNENIDSIGYGDPITVTARVFKDKDGLWEFSDENFSEIDEAIIDYNFPAE